MPVIGAHLAMQVMLAWGQPSSWFFLQQVRSISHVCDYSNKIAVQQCSSAAHVCCGEGVTCCNRGAGPGPGHKSAASASTTTLWAGEKGGN